MFVRALSLTDMPGLSLPVMQLSLPARSTDNLDSSGEPTTRSVGTTANLKGKMSKRLSVVKGHFPKLADCAHFHYENVDFASIELQFANEQNDASWTSSATKDLVFLVQVSCQGKTWMVRRSYEEFRTLDAHLHQCIYDRRYSQLLPLPPLAEIGDKVEIFTPLLSEYLSRLSMIVDNKLNCGPVLTWMEIDNHGNRFMLKEEASLNVPAIAAAHVIKRYTAQASDEISIEVGDILSVIDMPPKEDTSWWRGKHGFQVGFFPSECVELISEKLHQTVSAPASKLEVDGVPTKAGAVSATGPPSPTSVSKKHGKLMGFLRTFMKSRPTKQKLKQRGILKERVFGCDLGEHLLNSGLDVPQVLRTCSEFIEKHGIVDGIYRHSGVSSNIQKLRHEFDSENVPDLTKEVYMQDIHCVGSLCKLYFRELPNPLLTYQLYDKFADCMGEMTDDERMVKVHDVIQQLPPPHYRTLEFLIKHLARLATFSEETNMHVKNLAIVWAPNLLRSMEIEAVGLSGADPFKEVRIQSVVVEFLLSHVDVLFSDTFTSVGRFSAGRQSLTRPKSFVSTRLLSLEEAQARTQAPLLLQGAPLPFQGQFHTVLDFPEDRRKRRMKVRKASGGSWKTFFAIGKPGPGRRKPMRISSLFQPATSHAGCRVDSVTLRSAKSEESLSSQHSGAGPGKLQRLRRPRSSSDGLSLAASMDPQLVPQRPPSRLPSSRSYDSLLPEERRRAAAEEEAQEEDEDEEEDEEEAVYMLADFSQDPAASWMAEDVIDFSPTFLEDGGPVGLGGSAAAPVPGGRESPPAATPPPYRCLSHQSHAHAGSQRSITEDPDSVLNQSEAGPRRSLILAATAPQAQVYCQHRPSAAVAAGPAPGHGESSGSPSHSQTPSAAALSAPPAQAPQERRSFTRKVVHALSPKVPKSPPLDISDPIAISVPAKVLEMIGGRAGELQPVAQGGGPSQPPQMISMLLRSCDFQLTESCQQEISSKLGPEAKIKGPSIMGPTGVPLPAQQPPPPPPKNPARLMALALAESANKALRQGASPPYRPPQAKTQASDATDLRFQRSLSADASELLSSDPNQLYSTVRPLSVWMAEGDDTAAAEPTDRPGQEQEPRSPPGQDTGTLSSTTSVSDSGASNSELSAGSSSGDGDQTPSPIYKNQQLSPSAQGGPPSAKHSPSASSDAPPQRKPPAYSRQFSAPHLQQQQRSPGGLSKPAGQPPNPPHSQLLHSRSESSPLAQVRAFQPTRPKVPPKPLDLAPQRAPLSRADRQDYSRRSLDAGRVRRMMSQPQGTPPGLSRAYSERVAGTSDLLARYHAARAAGLPLPPPPPLQQQQQQPPPAYIRPVPSSSDDPGVVENFYYEIAAPEHPQAPPSYARHSYMNMRLDMEGNYRPAPNDPALNQRPVSRGHHHHHHHHPQAPGGPGGPGGRVPQLWSAEATRAWAAAHSHSYSFSHGHSHQQQQQRAALDGHGPRAQQQRQTSSSVRLPRNELHPIPLSPAAAGVPLSVHQRGSARSQRSQASAELAAAAASSQLHPYFENGKVCYRYVETAKTDEPPASASSQHATAKAPHPQTTQPSPTQTPKPPPSKEHAQSQPEPVYVNFPFASPQNAGAGTKGWLTTDLDGDASQVSDPLAPPPEPPPEERQESPHHAPPQDGPPHDAESPCHGGLALESRSLDIPQSTPSELAAAAHFRSRSDPQNSGAEKSQGPSQCLSGKEIASLLIEKLAEEESEAGTCTVASSSTSSSPRVEHPPNPYAGQQQAQLQHQQPPPAYNVYTPAPTRHSSLRDPSAAFHRQDPLRRSSGGQYRQAFDVMPSGDQVLKYYRSQDFMPGSQGESLASNPYPPRTHYPDAAYQHRGPQDLRPPYPGSPHAATPPSAAFSNLALGTPRGYANQPGGFQYSQYPVQPSPQYPPRRDVVLDPSLRPPPTYRNQRGLARQGSLPGPNWTIHTEGQTRSYC
ncbi:rho GTPase-activating protein 33 isoform X2 [Sardina pilchardus]